MLIYKLTGINLRLNGDKLRVETDKPLTNEQRSFLKLHKQQLLDELKLNSFLEKCCDGLDAEPAEVISRLLSKINAFDILAGDHSEECVRAHVQLWVIEGKEKIN